MYVDKTRSLPPSVVIALKALKAAQSGPTPPFLHGPEQPIPAAKKILRVGSWGPKRAFVECEDWKELLLLFPALKDRHHESYAILNTHWQGRKTFSPVTYTEEPLEFVSQMAVCGCHIHPDDVEHGKRNSGGVSLKQDARVRSADFFIRNGSTTGRENAFTRSPGFTPAALHYSNMHDDTMEQLAELQKTLFMVKVNAEMDMLQQHIENLEREALTASQTIKVASEHALLTASYVMMLAQSTDLLSKATADLAEARTSALDAEQTAKHALAAANDALAAASENVDYISDGLDNVSMFTRLRAARD